MTQLSSVAKELSCDTNISSVAKELSYDTNIICSQGAFI